MSGRGTERPEAEAEADPVRSRQTVILLIDALRDASAYLGALLHLARTEIRGNIRALAGLVILFGSALVLLVASLVLLLFALRDALSVVLGSPWAAGLIVASPFLVAAALLLRAGLRRFRLPALER